MKTAVSIPDDVFERADDVAGRLGWSRSHLYATALEAFLAEHADDPVTSALDALADAAEADGSGATSPGPARSLIDTGVWEW